MFKFLLIPLLLLTFSNADALETRKGKDVNKVVKRSEVIKRVVKGINKKYKGQVLSAKPVRSKNGPRVKVKFLTEDGVIRILLIDPRE